jgi:hypothetical protein
MARPDAPRTARSSPRPRIVPAPQDQPLEASNKAWPFAEGSQNHLGETAALWPRPPSRPASVWQTRSK